MSYKDKLAVPYVPLPQIEGVLVPRSCGCCVSCAQGLTAMFDCHVTCQKCSLPYYRGHAAFLSASVTCLMQQAGLPVQVAESQEAGGARRCREL